MVERRELLQNSNCRSGAFAVRGVLSQVHCAHFLFSPSLKPGEGGIPSSAHFTAEAAGAEPVFEPRPVTN